jgi:hypothetical protein
MGNTKYHVCIPPPPREPFTDEEMQSYLLTHWKTYSEGSLNCCCDIWAQTGDRINARSSDSGIQLVLQFVYFLKGPCHEIFDFRFFHQTTPSWPLTHRSFLHMASYLWRYSTMKSTFLVVSGPQK